VGAFARGLRHGHDVTVGGARNDPSASPSSKTSTYNGCHRLLWASSVVIAALAGAVIGGLIVRPDTTSHDADLACHAMQAADHVLPSVVTISAAGADGRAGTGTG